MSDMTEQEAWELDELLTKTTPEVDPNVQGPFIKHRNMMVIGPYTHPSCNLASE